MNLIKALIITTLFINSVFSQTTCVSGMAGAYACNNIDLMAQLDFPQIGGNAATEGSGCWGWTDPLTNKEYAIMGCTTHTAIVDITIPSAPIYMGKIVSHNNSTSLWREVNVYNNHLYIVSEASGHGMQIFDLTRLRSVTVVPQTFTPDARYTGFGNCHTVAINYQSGYAYCNGSATFSGGPHVVNLANPVAPVFSFGYSAQGYTHDSQIVNYNGPDIDHIGKELFIGANANKVIILDVTNKTNPILISTFTYPNRGYTHQGWFTEDQKYWILGDELDETNIGFNSKSIVIDMTNLDAPVLKFNYFGPTAAIDHNGYVKGNEFYLANYTAGIRIINTSNINTNSMNEVGFFDTFPENNNAQFNGVWNVYPYFPSGSIIMSDIDRGLFIVRKNAFLNTNEFEKKQFTIAPNPSNENITINLEEEEIDLVEIYNLIGSKIKSFRNVKNNSNFNISDISNGMYLIIVNDKYTRKLIKN